MEARLEVIGVRALLVDSTKFKKEDSGYQYEFLGREGGGAELCLVNEAENSVSREHAKLGWNEGRQGWAIQPLQEVSSNCQPLFCGQWHELKGGEELSFGSIRVRFTPLVCDEVRPSGVTASPGFSGAAAFSRHPSETDAPPKTKILGKREKAVRGQRYTLLEVFKRLEPLFSLIDSKLEAGQVQPPTKESIQKLCDDFFELFQKSFVCGFLEVSVTDGGQEARKRSPENIQWAEGALEQDLVLSEQNKLSYPSLARKWPQNRGHVWLMPPLADEGRFTEVERFFFDALFGLCSCLLLHTLPERAEERPLQPKDIITEAKKRAKTGLKFEEIKDLAVLPFVQEALRIKATQEEAAKMVGFSDRSLRAYITRIEGLLGEEEGRVFGEKGSSRLKR